MSWNRARARVPKVHTLQGISPCLYYKERIMKIPEEDRIPIFLSALQAAMLGGLSLIFFVLIP
jgi:hypothetical protein